MKENRFHIPIGIGIGIVPGKPLKLFQNTKLKLLRKIERNLLNDKYSIVVAPPLQKFNRV